MESVALNNNLSMPPLGLGVYLVTDVKECERSVDLALRAGYRSSTLRRSTATNGPWDAE